jgi:hypothetical protein
MANNPPGISEKLAAVRLEEGIDLFSAIDRPKHGCSSFRKDSEAARLCYRRS